MKKGFVAAAVLGAASLAHGQAVLEEVIVTAQKRAENLQDVPISVSAVQGEKIQDAGIPNMAALADYVPNLSISDGPVSTNIYMRGMGSSNNQAFEQSVGMYIDGIYMGRGRQYRAPFMDIERVEVLRGPQGILFGKNTVAGAVSVITASPELDESFNGKADLSLETNSGYIVEGMASGAVSDQLALRAAFKLRENDGYIDNVLLDKDEPEVEENVLRLTAVFEPNDTLHASLKYSYAEYERTGVGSGVSRYLTPAQRAELIPNAGAFTQGAYAVTDVFFPNFGADTSQDFTIVKDNNLGGDSGVGFGRNPEGSDNESDNVALNINMSLGEYTVTSVTGYSAYEYLDGCDCDWLPLQFIARDDFQEFDQFSQEFRLTSPTGGFFEYIVGAYYEQNTVEYDRAVTIDGSFGGRLQPVLRLPSVSFVLSAGQYTAAQLRRTHLYKVDSDSWALFGQGTFHLRDDIRLTLGLRYTEENKDVNSRQFLSDSLTGLDTPSDNWWLGRIMATTFDTYRYNYHEDRSTDDLLPQLTLQWDVWEDAMLYFSYSEGFKSGGFTGADDGPPGGLAPLAWPCALGQAWQDCYDPTRPADDFEFDDEEVTAFEFGGKHTLMGGAMTLNWAAYYTEYENLQTSIFKGVSFGVTNAAEVTVQGIEFDLLWQATDKLRVGVNGAWLDAEFDSYPTAPCTAFQLDANTACGVPGSGVFNDVDGENTTFAPEYTMNVFWDYQQLIGNNMEFFAGGEFNYSDEYDTQGDLDPAMRTEDFTKVNLRLGIRSLEDTWEVMLYGRNITDEEVNIYSFDVPLLSGSVGSMIDEGEVYGARVRYRF